MKYLVLILLFLSLSTYGKTLVLIGGGKRPAVTLKFFVNKLQSGPIYVLPWGTRFPRESFDSIRAELRAQGATDIRCFCTESFSDRDRESLRSAGGVYFPGGNQNKVMEKILRFNLKDLIVDLFEKGIPVAGTSAGTAIQSNPMLTGSGSETSEGLGLLKGFIVDQHFVVRGREARLLEALGNNSDFQGLGIDEDMSVVFHNDMFTALGPSVVVFYTKVDYGYQSWCLRHGESIVLKH